MSIDTVVLRRLRARFAEEIQKQNEHLLQGAGITDFADYRYYIGGIKGLRDAELMVDETIEEFEAAEAGANAKQGG